MGYIEASPVHPKTAFSIGLLDIHYTIRRYLCVRTDPFSSALDGWLNAFSPPINTQLGRRRDWRKPLSSASDAYCRLITAVQQRKVMLLRLEKMGKPAADWP
ncbi:hypothetical protein DFH28DRAFT_1116772 [Melampsora americana]|nr:hypothetical protein DFH28DRAFT_1116772 [Melampsora americana]